MEQHIKNAMNDTIIDAAAKLYNTRFEDIKYVGGFENFVYEFHKDQEDYIIRFVHSSHRSFDFVLSEIEFIDYLSKNQARVSKVIPTKDGQIAHKIPCEKDAYFTVSTFEKAPGTFIKQEDITFDFIKHFGREVGRLHHLTKNFKPKHKRYHFYEEDYLEIGRRNLPEDLLYVVDKCQAITEKIKAYDQDVDSYGLIHTDLHYGNMFYDGQDITFFDFDDMSYKHFISDIAIIIFYQFGLAPLTEEQTIDKSVTFLKPFLEGYREFNTIDKIWFERLNDFLKLRELILIMVLHAAGKEVIEGNFGQFYMNKFLPRAKNDTPFFDIQQVLNGIY